MSDESSAIPLVPEASGGCFKDQTRVCGADCMAYLTVPPTGARYTGQQWARCLVLVSQEKSAHHLTILANEVAKHLAAAARSAPPPGVR